MVSLQNQSPDTAKSAGVLLVDDDPALLQALSNMLALRMRELEVTTASSAPEALAHIQTNEFDAIICDIKMPGMDGLDLLAHVKRLQQETPVLLITGHGEHDLAIRALRGGAYDYLLKPIERDAFVAALRRALQTRKLRREVEEQQHALEQYATSLESMVEQRTAELAAANAELRTASEAKDTMLRMVTHELAGPLTSLKGMVQLLGLQLKRLSLSPQMQQSLNNIERSLNRLEMLIHDLQDTSLIQTGRFVLQYEPCNLVELCQQVLDEFTCGTSPQPEVSSGEEDRLEIIADIDQRRMSQVLLNLLSNARKYSAKNTPITLMLSYQQHEASIAVQDRGVGIPPEALSHIYEQFYRVPGIDVQQSGSSPGLGLGLYIAKAIVTQHGGHITVESTPGQGSTFTIALPAHARPASFARETGTDTPLFQVAWTFTPA